MLERQLENDFNAYWDAGASLRERGYHGMVTCARGTSDHAATFFKYLVETRTGLPVASLGPSVASIYGTNLKLDGYASIAFSQSGGSPDLAALQKAARSGGAQTIAILNVADSPLGQGAEIVLPIHAGPELAVAATKSFIGMMFASLGMVAGMTQDAGLKTEFKHLPELARQALNCSWTSALEPISRSNSIFCIGRGPGLAVASEAALKLKETCHLHAEAYSAAEVLHGPVALADENLCALAFDASGPAARSIAVAIMKMRSQNAKVFKTGTRNAIGKLPIPQDGHELFDPLLQAVAFYRFVEELSFKLGKDPDAPTGLRKVTKTL